MAHLTRYLRPLDTRDADFSHQSAVWAAQTQREITTLIEASKKTIADTRALMVDADRIFIDLDALLIFRLASSTV